MLFNVKCLSITLLTARIRQAAGKWPDRWKISAICTTSARTVLFIFLARTITYSPKTKWKTSSPSETFPVLTADTELSFSAVNQHQESLTYHPKYFQRTNSVKKSWISMFLKILVRLDSAIPLYFKTDLIIRYDACRASSFKLWGPGILGKGYIILRKPDYH